MKDKKEQQPQKPLGLLRQEFTEKIVKSINESELPLLVVEYILRDIMQELNNTLRQQDVAEMNQYKQQVAKTSEKSQAINEAINEVKHFENLDKTDK
ncbi:MAG: hypothetical protein IKE65_02955 [Clostridia bacterium]|nr:hypothetical protein [Clostridia bacterium]